MVSHGCNIERLTCDTESERMRLAYYRGIAAAGKDISFVKVFPWETLCDANPNLIHYIAHKTTKRGHVICGWMTVKHVPEWRGAYIAEITTRNATDKGFKGVGFMLHKAAKLNLCISRNLETSLRHPNLHDTIEIHYLVNQELPCLMHVS